MYYLNKLKNRKSQILDYNKQSKYAVLIPVVEINKKDYLLFEIRSRKLKIQPGEICFPGGRIEPEDKNEKMAAIRETCEELGLTKEQLEILGPLDLLVTPFNTLIFPYVARLKDYQRIKLNYNEVEEIFYVPVNFFLETKPQIFYNKVITIPPENFPFDLIPEGKNYNWRKGYYPVYFYYYQDKIIWGLTARILNNFVSLVAN